MKNMLIILLILMTFSSVATVAQKNTPIADSIVHFNMTKFGFGYDPDFIRSKSNRKGYYLELSDNNGKRSKVWADEKGNFTTKPYELKPKN